MTITSPPVVLTDGGRAAAGFKGSTGDCVTRAVAIATGIPYRDVYDLVHERNREFYATSRTRHAVAARRKGTAGRQSSPRDGVMKPVTRQIMADLGWEWTPTMTIGSGTTVHLRVGELPPGRLVVAVSHHLVAVINGVIHDDHDPSRAGTRCVYGFWTDPVTA